jgi:hypothetical protein
MDASLASRTRAAVSMRDKSCSSLSNRVAQSEANRLRKRVV